MEGGAWALAYHGGIAAAERSSGASPRPSPPTLVQPAADFFYSRALIRIWPPVEFRQAMLEKMEQAPIFGLINRVNRLLDSK